MGRRVGVRSPIERLGGMTALAGRKDHPCGAVMITNKVQTTIPQSVRAALRLGPGDEVAYVIEAGRVVPTRAQPNRAAHDPFRSFGE